MASAAEGPPPLMGHLTPAAQRELAGALLEVQTRLRDLCAAAGSTIPAEGSRARDWYGEVPLGTVSPRRIYLQLVMAGEFGLAAQRLLRDPVSFGASLASLTRSHLEALAVAWWLLAARDHVDLEARAAVLELHEFDETSTVTEARDFEGILADPRAVRRGLEQAVSRWARPGRRVRLPNRANGVAALVGAAGMPDSDREYAVLSGLAHAAGYMVQALGARTPTETAGLTGVHMGLPQRYAEIYLWDLLEPLLLVVRAFCDLVGMSAEKERFEEAFRRSADRVADVFNGGRAESGEPPLESRDFPG